MYMTIIFNFFLFGFLCAHFLHKAPFSAKISTQ